MRTDEQFKSEVFIRAAKYNQAKVKKRKIFVTVTLPLVFVVVISVAVLPSVLNINNFNNKKSGNNISTTVESIYLKSDNQQNKGNAYSDCGGEAEKDNAVYGINDCDSLCYILEDGVYSVKINGKFVWYMGAMTADKILITTNYDDNYSYELDSPTIIEMKNEEEEIFVYEYQDGIVCFEGKCAVLAKEDAHLLECVIAQVTTDKE